MPNSSKYGKPDPENPEWEPGAMAKAMRFGDLPSALQTALTPKPARGAQKAPKKQHVSIRLSPDVLTALRAKGRGWQALVDSTLRDRFVVNE